MRAGLLATAQGHLLLACTALTAAPGRRAVASGGVSAGVLVQRALAAVEALRLWRVCAAQGVPLAGFEGVHGALCGVMSPPDLPPAAAASSDPPPASPGPGARAEVAEGREAGGGARRAAGAASAARAEELLGVLRWHVAREAHSLLDALQSHALRAASGPPGKGLGHACGGTAGDCWEGRSSGCRSWASIRDALWRALVLPAGDKTVGAAMLQPGTAAALATAVHGQWLSGAFLAQVAAELVSLPAMAPPTGGTPLEWDEW